MNYPSLSADRKEMAPSQRSTNDLKTASRTVNAFQISTNLATSGAPQETLARAKDIILSWVVDAFDLQVAEGASRVDNPRAGMDIVEVEDANVWAMRLEEKPESLTLGQNIHEVEILIKPGELHFIYRLTVAKFPGPDHRAPRVVPAFVQEIATEIGFVDGGRIMNGSAWVIENENDLEKFYAFLISEDRKMPVYMVTETGRSMQSFSTLVDHEELAGGCLGVAHVALMTYAMGYHWTQRVGKWLSAYLGTVRTYQPNTPINEENKHKHPLAMPERIANWEHEDLRGPMAFAKFLELQAMQASASPQNWRERFVPITALKSRALAGEFEFNEETHWTEMEKRYQRKVSLLEERIAEMAQDAVARDQENNKLKAENTLLSSKLHQMERAIQNRPATVQEAAHRPAASEASAEQITAIPKWIQQMLGSRVLLSEEAVEEMSEASADQFENIAVLKDCLMLLAGDVRDTLIRSDDIAKSRAIRDTLRDLNATIEPIDSHELNSYEDTYTFHLGDQEDFLVRWILKRGDGRDEKKVLRIYFDFNPNNQSILVGHMPNYVFPDECK